MAVDVGFQVGRGGTSRVVVRVVVDGVFCWWIPRPTAPGAPVDHHPPTPGASVCSPRRPWRSQSARHTPPPLPLLALRSPTRSTCSTSVTGNQSLHRSGVLLVTFHSYCSVTCYQDTTGITATPNSEGPRPLLLEYVGPRHRLRHLPRGPPILMVFPQCCSAPAKQARGRA